MSEETIEQVKARLKREDEKKERARQKTLAEFDADAARYRAEKEEEQREKERASEKLIRERQEERVLQMKESARSSYLDAGGTEEEFEKAWPEIKAEMLKRRTLEGDSQARADFQRAMWSSF
jgi:hypothetical protein